MRASRARLVTQNSELVAALSYQVFITRFVIVLSIVLVSATLLSRVLSYHHDAAINAPYPAQELPSFPLTLPPAAAANTNTKALMGAEMAAEAIANAKTPAEAAAAAAVAEATANTKALAEAAAAAAAVAKTLLVVPAPPAAVKTTPKYIAGTPLSAALIVIYSEHRKSLLTSIANWAEYAPWLSRYELVVFYVEGVADPSDLAKFVTLAPTFKIKLLPFQYNKTFQDTAYTGGGGGGAWINWMLAHEIYFNTPYLDQFDYFMRMDDDVFFYAKSAGDPFVALATAGARVGWKQKIPDNDVALASDLFSRANTFSTTFAALGDVWPQVSVLANRGPHNTHSNWRPYLVAGCVEIYAASVFRTRAYQSYLAAVGAMEGLRQRLYWEQEVKTMWMQLSVPADEWLCVGCLMPMTHKNERQHDNFWYIDSECDFRSGLLTGPGTVCTLDPQMRFC